MVASYLVAFQHCTLKTREPGKTYHMSDVAGGTDLFNSSGTKSSWFHPLRHSHKALSLFLCYIEKLEEAAIFTVEHIVIWTEILTLQSMQHYQQSTLEEFGGQGQV